MDERRELLRLRHAQTSAAISLLPVAAKQWQAANKLLDLYEAVTFPWEDKKAPVADKVKMREAYVKRFGDPNDPEVRERVRQTVAALKAKRLASRPQRRPKKK